MYVSLCRGIPESSFRKPPRPEPQQQQQQQQHLQRLNFGGGGGGGGGGVGGATPGVGGGGVPRRKISNYARPTMELETLMEEGAAGGRGEGDDAAPLTAAADGGGTRAPLVNGDDGAPHDRHRNRLHREQRKEAAAMKPSSGTDRPHSALNLMLAACTVNMGALAAGCALTWSSPTLDKLKKGDWDGEETITDEQASWVGSLVTLGAAIGPLLAGALLDRLGRKNTILLSMVLSAASWLAVGFVPSLHALYGARVLAGVAVGIIFTAVPMYIAEISEVHLRSALGTLMQFFLVAGFLLEYVVGPYTSYFTLAIVSLTMPILCLGTFMWMPDSPQSLLVRAGGEQKAMESLRWLRGNPTETALVKELDEIKRSVDESKRQKSGVRELFANRGNVKAVFISCAMVAWQQLSGINVVLLFSEIIFTKTGVEISASVSTIIVGSVMLLAAGATPPLAKLTSMRVLLCVSAVGMAVTEALLGLFFYLQNKDPESVKSIGWLPVTSLVFFIMTYCVGFGPLPWAIMGEIFPGNLKSVASGLTASFCWFLGFILTKSFDPLCKAIGEHSVFWLYAIFCVFALLFTVFLLPDTEGKTLQEIQDMLQGNQKSASDSHKMTKA